jgi:hypothetical protein
MKITKTILLFFAVTAIFTQCKKDKNSTSNDTTATDSSKTVVLDVHLDLTSWVYYSFEKNAEIHVKNSADTLSWDLGVHYQTFRTNGGASSSIGQGAVLDLGAVDYSSVNMSSIGSKAFTLDDTISVIDSMTSVGPVLANTPGSVPLGSMFAVPQGPPPHTYTPNNHVYIIRTAAGKYVKLIGTSFFNDLGAEGYFNFKYEHLD